VVDQIRGMLDGIMSENSRYNTLPISRNVNLSNEKRVRTIEESSGSRKKRSCGKYNRNNTFNVFVKRIDVTDKVAREISIFAQLRVFFLTLRHIA
jgi:hypothetical protein